MTRIPRLVAALFTPPPVAASLRVLMFWLTVYVVFLAGGQLLENADLWRHLMFGDRCTESRPYVPPPAPAADA